MRFCFDENVTIIDFSTFNREKKKTRKRNTCFHTHIKERMCTDKRLKSFGIHSISLTWWQRWHCFWRNIMWLPKAKAKLSEWCDTMWNRFAVRTKANALKSTDDRPIKVKSPFLPVCIHVHFLIEICHSIGNFVISETEKNEKTHQHS